MNVTILQRTEELLLPAIALALLMMFAACGGSDAPTAPSTSGTTAAPTADETPLGPPPGSVAEDREILIAVYNALDGPNWESPNPGRDSRENWLSDAPLGEWAGVTTAENGRVIWLQLGEYKGGLSGEIPPELVDLGALTVLSLYGDGLSGEIPPELGNLSNLRDLSITGNGLRVKWGDSAGAGQPFQPSRPQAPG